MKIFNIELSRLLIIFAASIVISGLALVVLHYTGILKNFCLDQGFKTSSPLSRAFIWYTETFCIEEESKVGGWEIYFKPQYAQEMKEKYGDNLEDDLFYVESKNFLIVDADIRYDQNYQEDKLLKEKIVKENQTKVLKVRKIKKWHPSFNCFEYEDIVSFSFPEEKMSIEEVQSILGSVGGQVILYPAFYGTSALAWIPADSRQEAEEIIKELESIASGAFKHINNGRCMGPNLYD